MKEQNCGALWKHESKAGETYLSGVVEIDGKKVDIVVFKNKYKEEPKHPDYRIFPSTPQGEQQPVEAKEDDIPF